MSNPLRGRLWLIGSVVSLSLLGACAPENEGTPTESPPISEAGTVGQDLSAGTDLRNVTVSVSAKAALISTESPAEVTVTLRNDGRTPVKLLQWYTPANGLEEPLFVVTRNGQEVKYLGAHYKRPAAQAEDYLRVAAGESLTWTVDLTESYDLSQTDDYSIRFAVGALQSNELKLWIEGRPSGHRASEPDVTPSGSVAFSRCDSTQQATVTQALSSASNYANGAVTYLNGTPSATPRYTTWFGAYSSSGWNTARNHFIAIKDVYDTKTTTFDCSCKKKYYAYVYPNQPYKIYLCSVFWRAPMTGTDSKAGTIIHETSHFTVVAGTDDWAYGQTNARALAISDPTKALNNADNHEYFAENTPFLQ